MGHPNMQREVFSVLGNQKARFILEAEPFKLTLKTVESLKKAAIADICMEPGDFQEGTGSMSFHFFSSINEINESLSRPPLYCLNSPLATL